MSASLFKPYQRGHSDPRINMDPHANDYVQDIFGNQYSVIDNIERLPEKLPQLFMASTK